MTTVEKIKAIEDEMAKTQRIRPPLFIWDN